MFTQRNEEKYITRFFKNKTNGKFLDIGAYDGKCFSTTHALALQGWEGVCVEPSISVFSALKKLYEDNDKIQTLEFAIANTTGKIDFFDCGGDMVSTVSKEHVKLWEEKGGSVFKTIQVNSLTAPDLFKMIGYDFDFISLDVEGTNIEILKQFPFELLTKTKMLCIEFDHQENTVLELVAKYNFTEYHRTAENLLLVR